MNYTYNASFNTTGKWLIPYVLGWSKSKVILNGYTTIGIMYTLHITPFLNIGVNDIKPKNKTNKEPCHGCTNCSCCETDNVNNASDDLHGFLLQNTPNADFKITIVYNEYNEPALFVTSPIPLIGVPDNFNGFDVIFEQQN